MKPADPCPPAFPPPHPLVQHVGATYVFIHPLKMGYVGAAWATTW